MTTRNAEVVRAFLVGTEARSENLQTDGEVLTSYGKAVAVRRSPERGHEHDGVAVEYLNNVVGSSTTAEHLSLLRSQVRAVRVAAGAVRA